MANKTFTEKVSSIVPQLKHQGLFHGFEIERVDSGTYESGYQLSIKLNTDQIPDLEGMELRRLYKHFAATGYGSGRDVNAEDKKQIQELMKTTIVKDLATIQFYLPNQMYVDFSDMCTIIFADYSFDLREYEKIIADQGAKILENKLWDISNVNQRHYNDNALKEAFLPKLKTGGIIFNTGGHYSEKVLIDRNCTYASSTRQPTNIRTFEVLGETEKPWYETNVRSAFTKILEKELMNDKIEIIDITFTDTTSLIEKVKPLSDVKDVAEKRELLDNFTMRKKIPIGKKGVVVLYKKEYSRYLLEVYGETRKTIEDALLQLK
jgi:hypothetical protein